MSKLMTKAAFMSHLKDEQSFLVGGFMACGTPEKLIDWIVESNIQDITIICNDAGFPDRGVGKLIKNNQVKHLIASHIGLNPYAGSQMSEGLLSVDLVPQGTLAERIRAFGAGLGGVLTPTGLRTIVEADKQIISVKDKDYLLETALGADVALIEAEQSDSLGNLTYAKTARNFNPVMATAAKKVFALVHNHVDIIDPECVITPHVFIDFVIDGGANHER